MLPWDLQRPPRSVPNPSKIEPGAAQDAQKQTKSNDKHSQTRKKRPRSAQERKVVPTWPRQGEGVFRIFDPLASGPPPLRYLQQLKHVYKNRSLWFNTPGHRTAVRRIFGAPGLPKGSKILINLDLRFK